MLIKVDKQKTDTLIHVREASVCPDACVYNAQVLSMCNKHLILGQTAVIYTHAHSTLSLKHSTL